MKMMDVRPYDLFDSLRYSFDREPPEWNKRKKEREDAFKSKYLGKWVGDGLAEGLEEPVAPSVDKALDKLRVAMIDTSKVSKNNQIVINIDEKENNNMATSITNYAMPKNEPEVPQCIGIIRRDKTTRVDWADDTRTIVILEEGKEDLDMFHTFCIAFTKKMLGGTTKILKTIEECDTDTIERKRKEAIEKANREAEEEAKKLKAEMEKAAFERAVQERMFENRVFEEAIRRIQIREERRSLKANLDAFAKRLNDEIIEC